MISAEIGQHSLAARVFAALLVRTGLLLALCFASPVVYAQSCASDVPRLDSGEGFTPFGEHEQALARAGNARHAWEWALGPNTESHQKVRGNLDWVSGRVYHWTLVNTGAGREVLKIRDGGRVLLRLTYPSQMHAGNALELRVSANPSIDPHTTIAATLTKLNGHAVSGSLYRTGRRKNSEQALYYYFPQMAQGFIAEGTVSLTYWRKRPTGSRVVFTVRAGTIPCDSPANSPPMVSIMAPAANSVFSSPATITVSAEAQDADGTVTKVAFFANGSVIGTATSSPFAVQWSDAGPGSYSLTAVATDNDGSQITSSPTAITITATRLLYFIHVDHLNTPRLVVNAAGTPVWQWDQLEAFGTNSAKTNAYDLYASDMPLRFPGQQYDVETTLHYNYFRHYDPNIGRYRESDPIGLMGGLNTYGYSEGSPTTKSDPRGLMATAIHVDLSREAMRAECPKLAGGAAYMSGGPADRGEGSQLPENARRHCMRTPGEDLQTGKSNHDAWVMSQLRQCTVPGLGKALHAVQDCYASGHKDYQTWDGHMTKTHAWGDVVGGRDAAIEASKALIRLFKEICPCMCQ